MYKFGLFVILFLMYKNGESCDQDSIRNLLPKDGTEQLSHIAVNFIEIPVICEGVFRSTPQLSHIQLYNSSIKNVQPRTFENLSKLTAVSIIRGDFRTVKKGVFNGLPITTLNLKDNGIENIEEGAFEDMEFLKTISLEQNRLKQFSPDWFGNGANLKELILNENIIEYIPEKAFGKLVGPNDFSIQIAKNNINEIHVDAFRDLKTDQPIRKEILLAYNKIKELNENIFAGIRLSRLDLMHNLLECVSDEFLKKIIVTEINFGSNPLKKDCLEKIKNWSESTGVFVKFGDEIAWPTDKSHEKLLEMYRERQSTGWIQCFPVVII